jgi:hypothetical protein
MEIRFSSARLIMTVFDAVAFAVAALAKAHLLQKQCATT